MRIMTILFLFVANSAVAQTKVVTGITTSILDKTSVSGLAAELKGKSDSLRTMKKTLDSTIALIVAMKKDTIVVKGRMDSLLFNGQWIKIQ